ncbi:hypothetical protein SV7mr_00240 [Stieleria bergensis]|uniref:Endonuclease/Exonuclease/phosphatase family protein n=1 Tax=Stieleria bergensis TaxID=2528025 RepID=A0A517SN49_9BACT|nr:hypothetical protein SV7mr_00240 [Planctomycetes bacterium SV_7m_r]
MEESNQRNPFGFLLVLVAVIGGGLFFLSRYEIIGLSDLSVKRKDQEATGTAESQDSLINFQFTDSAPNATLIGQIKSEKPTVLAPQILRVGSWALCGYGASKFDNRTARETLVKMIRQFDILALQQVSAKETDLIPRLLDEINRHAGAKFEYVLGTPTGPADRLEVPTIIFNTHRCVVDRSATYMVADPQNIMQYDTLVAYFQTKTSTVPGSSEDNAWTFFLANVRVDMSEAQREVATLQQLMDNVRNVPSVGEDDVVLAGLLQADNSYLTANVFNDQIDLAVMNAKTDVFDKYQTANIAIDKRFTTEYLGRGGPVDFRGINKLTVAQAEMISSQLPVYAEFSIEEGTIFGDTAAK